MVERVPRIIRGLLRLVCPDGIIMPVTVEVFAVRAGVIEHPVQKNGDAKGLCFCKERAECVIASEHGVYMFVISGIIFMVGVRVEDRTEVETGYAERSQIREFFRHTGQCAAEKFIVFDISAGNRRKFRNPVFPVRILFGIRFGRIISAFGKPIYKHLIKDTAGQPCRNRFFFLINGDLFPFCVRFVWIKLPIGGGKLRAVRRFKPDGIKEQPI